MAFGNNRAGEQPRSHFRQAGGSSIKFRHPFFAGQIATTGTAIDEIDISAACKLDGRFFEAMQNQDNARQVVMVDGSVVTITNKLLNGTLTIQAVPTTNEVATGDLIAACHLIRSTGDNVGGLLYKTDFINGKAHTKLFFGVTVQSCPDDISEGNDVPVYPVRLLYAGWIEAVNTTIAGAKKSIWSVGAQEGYSAYFAPYPLQNSNGETGTGDSAMDGTTSGSGVTDDTSAAYNEDNVSGTTIADMVKAKKYGKILSDIDVLSSKA